MQRTLINGSETLRLLRSRAPELCTLLGEHGATNIAVFGSVARGDDHSDSDIDLLVDLAPSVSLFDLVRMQSAAEALLGRTVDIVPRSSLKHGVAPEVQRDVIAL